MKLSARATRLIEGFTTDLPTNAGCYLCACLETDHDEYAVTISDELIVSDPEIGEVPLSQYDLTDLLWKRLKIIQKSVPFSALVFDPNMSAWSLNTGVQPCGDGMTKFEVVLYCGTRVITRGLTGD